EYNSRAGKVWTTQQAYEWIRRELPPGTSIRLEGSLAPKLPPTYRTSYVTQLRRDGVEFYKTTDIQYLVASSQCYGPYFQEPEKYRSEHAEYQQICQQTEHV